MAGFIGLLVTLFGMNFTQPFSIGMVVSEYTTAAYNHELFNPPPVQVS